MSSVTVYGRHSPFSSFFAVCPMLLLIWPYYPFMLIVLHLSRIDLSSSLDAMLKAYSLFFIRQIYRVGIFSLIFRRQILSAFPSRNGSGTNPMPRPFCTIWPCRGNGLQRRLYQRCRTALYLTQTPHKAWRRSVPLRQGKCDKMFTR